MFVVICYNSNRKLINTMFKAEPKTPKMLPPHLNIASHQRLPVIAMECQGEVL